MLLYYSIVYYHIMLYYMILHNIILRSIRASLLTPTPTANENQGQPLGLLQDIQGV